MEILLYWSVLGKVHSSVHQLPEHILSLFFNTGEFGIVYKARLQLSKAVVAVKTFKGMSCRAAIHLCPPLFVPAGDVDQVEVDKFLEESLKMSRFSHAHVMSLTGVCLEAGYIIMPYMANGSLLTYLRRERKNLVLHESDEDEVTSHLVTLRSAILCLGR